MDKLALLQDPAKTLPSTIVIDLLLNLLKAKCHLLTLTALGSLFPCNVYLTELDD